MKNKKIFLLAAFWLALLASIFSIINFPSVYPAYADFHSKEAAQSTPLLNITYTAESTPPFSNFTNVFPLNYSWQNTNFSVNISYSDTTNLGTCGFSIEKFNGASWSNVRNSSVSCTGTINSTLVWINVSYNGDCNLDTILFINFSCRVKGWVIDAVSNYNDSSFRYFRTDSTLPIPTFGNPTPGNATSLNANTQNWVFGNITLVENNTGTLYANWNGTRIPPSDNLIAWWDFHEAGGNISSSVESGGYGTLNLSLLVFPCLQVNCHGRANWNSSGRIGPGISGGANLATLYILFAGRRNLSNYTIAMWVNPIQFVDGGNLVVFRNNTDAVRVRAFYSGTAGNVRFHGTNPDAGAIGILDCNLGNVAVLNQWNHLVFSFDGITSRIYKNGTLCQSVNASVNVTSATTLTLMGSIFGGNTNHTMDEILFYNRSLDTSEIRDLYELQAWRFNKTNITERTHYYNITAIDAAGNKNWTETRSVRFFTTAPLAARNFSVTLNGTNYTAANVTIRWSAGDANADFFKLSYSASNPFDFTNYINVSDDSPFYTQTNASSYPQIFYRVSTFNPIADNVTSTIGGKEGYTIRRDAAGTGENWIGMPINATFVRAQDIINETGRGAPNSTTVSKWNSSSQKYIVCDDYNCPDDGFCTVGSDNDVCNFQVKPFDGYRLQTNLTAPTSVSWAVAGLVFDIQNVSLQAPSGDFALNLIGLCANTTSVNANSLLNNITTADAVSVWNESRQTTEGYIQYRGGRGNNFPISLYKGYFVSVTENTNWSSCFLASGSGDQAK